MIVRLYSSLLLSLFCVAARGETLEALLARLDKAAESFTAVTASLKQTDHTDIFGENEQRTAAVKLKRGKNGLLARVDFNDPRSVYTFRERTVEIYTPKSNTVQIYDFQKYGHQVDQFLLLGFGTSGRDLLRDFKVKLIGPATIGEIKTTHIEITPKSREMQEHFAKAELWIALASTYPVQEKFHTNEKDYKLFLWSEVKLNAPVADKDLELQLPPGVQKLYPQK